MRSIIAAAATANFGGQSVPLESMDQFVGSLPGYLARGAGTGVLSAAIQKQSLSEGLVSGVTFGAASAIGNYGATNLGQAYNYGTGDISYAQHKLGHMALGGALGAMISKDRLKGAFIGGLSAAGAEVMAEALTGDVRAQVMDLREVGFDFEQTREHIHKLARFNSEFSKLAAAGIAAACDDDVTTALFTASNAVTNNMEAHLDPLMHNSFGAEMTVGPRGTGGGSLGGSRTISNPPRTGSSGNTMSEAAAKSHNNNINALDLAKSTGRAPEIAGGKISEGGFLDAAMKYLGEGYKSLPNGRYVSKDGLRQVRYGKHEISSKKHHAHFEAYDKPDGRVIQNTQVEITKE